MKSMSNRLFFHELTRYKFGRKIAYADAETVTEDNIVKIASEGVSALNYNRIPMKYLWDYKKGDQPALYRTKTIRDDINNKVIENHAWEIVRYKNGQTYGEPVQYVSLSKDESVNAVVDRLNDYMRAASKAKKDIDSGEWTSAVGTGFKAIQRKKGEIPFRIVTPSPMNTVAVYSRITEEHILTVQELKDAEGEYYWLCYSDTHEYRIKNGRLMETTDTNGRKVLSKPHGFGGIPIIEYPNNQDRISDIELVISMLDAINTMQSNRMDSVEQFVQSWVKFVNCEIDEATFSKMKDEGALVVKSNNGENRADVDILTQELNQGQAQVAKDDIWDNILNILAIPNKQDNQGAGDTQGAVSLRNGWDFSKQAARIKDHYVMDGDKKLGMLVLNQLRLAGVQVERLGVMDFEAHVSHSPTDNMFTKSEALQILMQTGIHPKVAIETSGLWTDSEKVYLLSKPYIEEKYNPANGDDTNADASYNRRTESAESVLRTDEDKREREAEADRASKGA